MLYAQDAKTARLTPAEEKDGFVSLFDGQTLNGTVITDADISDVTKTMDYHEHPDLHNPRGYISWLGHGNPPDPVEFRNVRIKELP